MKKILFVILILFSVGLVACMTKPDDKTCIIKAVESVWGDKTPDKYHLPEYYGQFMDVTSKAVQIDDWIIIKRIQYTFDNQKRTIGFGFFNHVILR